MSTIDQLKGHYRSGRDDLSSAFFQPCMREASRYRRAVGYFSTSALLSWTDALPRLALEDCLKIQLIASPELSEQDRDTLRGLGSATQRDAYRAMVVEKVLEAIVALIETPSDIGLRAQILAWLVANERLELRFAFAEHVDDPGIFHEKIGIFDFPENRTVAFTGSANETLGGHRRNYESIDVYRSWLAGETERVAVKCEQFEEAWDGLAEGLSVLAPKGEVLDRLRARAPRRLRDQLSPTDKAAPSAPDPRWRHQDDAVAAFMAAHAGILEMATGTGKTRTAIKILDRLIAEGQIDSAIVTMDGTDLLDQWAAELDGWALRQKPSWLVYKHFERHHELGEFALDPDHALLVVSREQLHKILSRLPDKAKAKMLIVHDEVHGLGTPSLVRNLATAHDAFIWKLGLSATPDRAYDAVGNAFIQSALGPTLFEFPLEAAIRRGVLSEFDYLPLPYDLTDGDRDRLSAVYAKKAARAHEGNPMRDEELWTEIAKIYKTAEMKPSVFADHLRDHPEWLNRAILFVETKEYGAQILTIIDRYTHRYRTYYADDDRAHLVSFADGEIDSLITCHRISQGIDIRSLSTVVLFASARAKLETIQRIGRVLRTDPDDPGKRALVIDFVRPAAPGDTFLNADQERSTWLTDLAMTRREPNDGA
ncbi:DEAD/DEAH box helicase family protein [Sphingobium sp. AS12]|uniref:DEAD/DEAH box helicase family protein n=1 Tax=Sphingobium sp. AS12 TaxID=2849495 RepID=UPI001C31A22F|nr:DEAD/DEAH box helicase family protein [Sphingobium sp. AS12]MBV2149037.1 DEAD/DEAH box helicase family protein [Sphingobium sp. AS12]